MRQFDVDNIDYVNTLVVFIEAKITIPRKYAVVVALIGATRSISISRGTLYYSTPIQEQQ